MWSLSFRLFPLAVSEEKVSEHAVKLIEQMLMLKWEKWSITVESEEKINDRIIIVTISVSREVSILDEEKVAYLQLMYEKQGKLFYLKRIEVLWVKR